MSSQNDFLRSEELCYVCNGKLVFDYETVEKVCSNCGIVSTNKTESQLYKSSLPIADHEQNTLQPRNTSLIMYEINLPTMIGKKNIDAHGKQIKGFSDMERLRRLHKYSITDGSRTRNLTTAAREIRRISEKIGVNNSVAERAAYIYRKALTEGLVKGRSITGIVAACVYISCKQLDAPRTLGDIQMHVGESDRRSISHYFKFLLRRLKINLLVSTPSINISKIARRSGLSGKTERKGLEILDKVNGDPVLSGKKPVSLAASALYLASILRGEKITQSRLAVAAELTTITIRKRYLEILQILKNQKQFDLIPTDIIQNDELPKTDYKSSNNFACITT